MMNQPVALAMTSALLAGLAEASAGQNAVLEKLTHDKGIANYAGVDGSRVDLGV